MELVGGARATEVELPLDVHYASVADWLRDRGKLSKQWPRALKDVHARVEKALVDARPTVPAAAEALREEPVGHDACKRVVQALAEAGLDKRTMLGGYVDPCMKQWAAISALYGRENLHVAELYQRLLHDATYELPALRKELEAAEANLQEAARKRQESLRTVETSKQRLAADCAKLGVAGKQPRAEVQLLASQLPSVFRAASELLAEPLTLEAVQMYRAWSAACLARMGELAAGTEGGKGKGGKGALKASAVAAISPSELLTMLARAHAAGRLELGAEAVAASAAAGCCGAEVEIDWGGGRGDAGEDAGGAAADIDWGGEGDVAADAGGAAVEIDWGGDADAGAGAGAAVEIDWGGEADTGADAGGAAVEIDWGGEASAGADAGGAEVEIDWGGEAGESGESGTSWIEVKASGDDREGADGASSGALALYEQQVQRDSLVDDLLELEAFLRQRLADERSADSQVLSALSAWPEFSALQVGGERLKLMLAHVESARGQLDSARTRQLLLIQSSSAYADRLAAGVQQSVDHLGKVERKAEEWLERVAALSAEKATTLPRYTGLRESTLAKKRRLADEISRLFAGRAINLMGDLVGN